MDKISQLPDELLLKVMLFLPTKVAVSTSILSKRWEFLWMWLPKLEYDYDSYSYDERKRLRHFINLNMPLHRAPVIESLRLKFSQGYIGSSIKPEDIRLWVVFAVSRCVRELSLNLYSFSEDPTKLPSSLYTCKSLVTLTFIEEILVDVPRVACLPSLKCLILRCVTYEDENSLEKLLSSCPVLEDLVVERNEYDHFEALNVTVPSLQRLTLTIFRDYDFESLVINTPSLKYLKVKDYQDEANNDINNSDSDYDDRYSFYSEDMSKLEDAEINSTYPDVDKFVTSIRYVKRLSLCVRVNAEEALYRDGIVFNQLEHLKLCSCDSNWSKLLVRLLKDSPNLRELEVYLNDDHTDSCFDPSVCWESQMVCVPTCLLSSLETFKWTGIYGSQKEIDLIKYVLRNALCLKTATILFRSSNSAEEEYELEMLIHDLSLSFRGSKTCQLVFD